MSLLFTEYTDQSGKVAQKVFDDQFLQDEKLKKEYDARRKRLMLRDIQYNIHTLELAVMYQSPLIMTDYSVWLYRLMAHRMVDLSDQRVKQQMVDHLLLLKEKSHLLFHDETHKELAKTYMEKAIQAVKKAKRDEVIPKEEKYGSQQQAFLNALLNSDRRKAETLIQDMVEEDTKIEDIYIHIFQKTMMEVGHLWHIGKIMVDKEHYCTAMTQSIMTQLYPIIFRTPRVGKKILACCVGNELHEMGIRMLCDLFELHGWDSIYLGQAVPTDGIIHALDEEKPDVVALSVSIANNLKNAKEAVDEIRSLPEYQDIKIALGGRAINMMPNIQKEWPIDVTTKDAIELIQWAKQNV